MIVLQVSAVMAFLFAPPIAGELAWRWWRGRRPRSRRVIGVGAGVALVLEAAVVALGLANREVAGYLLFGIGMITIVIFMTAYYAWRARSVAKRWWRRAETENDPSRNRA